MSDKFSPAEFAALFADIGQKLDGERDDKAVLNALSVMAVETVPGAEHAGITLGREGGTFATVAATDDLVNLVDQIQYDLVSGPCVDAILKNTTFKTADLRTDTRWPEFGHRAVETGGVISMLSLRLYTETDGGSIAGLNMYSHTRDAFDDSSEAIATLLATHGSLAVGKAAAQAKAANLLVALKTNREIGVAMGILMNRHHITRDQAFDLLRITSQHAHRKVADIAIELGDTGELPKLPTARPSIDVTD
jgi:ANTAR domain-containing protein/GAF domain-containing protein